MCWQRVGPQTVVTMPNVNVNLQKKIEENEADETAAVYCPLFFCFLFSCSPKYKHRGADRGRGTRTMVVLWYKQNSEEEKMIEHIFMYMDMYVCYSFIYIYLLSELKLKS